MTARALPGRALLETLRAPLLLSPIADVTAGWAVAGGGSDSHGPLVLAGACGCCLLAAGMAQNALADRDDDAQRKPGRPIPSGAIGVGAVKVTFTALTLAALGLAAAVPDLLPMAAAIVVLTAGYHYLLKQWRIPGCVALGTLRGLDMGLGVVAAGVTLGLDRFGQTPLLVCALYGLYVTGASLHASTDDEDADSVPSHAVFSRVGLGIALLVLGVLAVVAAFDVSLDTPTRMLGPLVLVLAIVRLERARRRLPPPAVTGAALSSLYLIGSGLAFASGRPLAGAFVLLLFVASRALLKVFPPS